MVRTGYAEARTPLLLTVDEVGNTLALSRATVYRLIEAGELVPIHVGPRSPRFRPEDVEAFVERKREAAA